MQMSAPAWARASAIPSPMPPLPPVTRAVLPVRSKVEFAMVSPPFYQFGNNYLEMICGVLSFVFTAEFAENAEPIFLSVQ
jgi:hypothetical protein